MSPLHAAVIAGAIEHVLADNPFENRTTASVLPLLELLREASTQVGRAVSERARASLTTLETKGKTGRVVSELLALKDVPDTPAWKKAQTQALSSRIARAERWTAWEQRSGRAAGRT